MCRSVATLGLGSWMKDEGVPVSAFFRECLCTGTPQQIHDRAPSPSHAVGWNVLQLKVGSFSRSERMAKWNEALRIEEVLDGYARFAGAEPWRGRATTGT